MKLEELAFSGIKIGIFGLSGSGKTRLAGTFVDAGEVTEDSGRLLHMICSSNGMNEARSLKGIEGIDPVEIKIPDDLSKLVQYARESGKYSTVVLDHVTEYTNLVLSSIIGRDKMPEQSAWGIAKQQDYAQMSSQAKEYLRELFDFPGNVIIIGQERVFNAAEEGDSSELIQPNVSIACTPSVSGWIAPACDYFTQMFKRTKTIRTRKKIGDKVKEITKRTNEVEYCLRCGPDQVVLTKWRCGPGNPVPRVIVDPSYTKLEEFFG